MTLQFWFLPVLCVYVLITSTATTLHIINLCLNSICKYDYIMCIVQYKLYNTYSYIICNKGKHSVMKNSLAGLLDNNSAYVI